MIEVVSFKKEHLFQISEQPGTLGDHKPLFTNEVAEQLEKEIYSFSAVKDGKVLACAGVVQYWQGRGEAWTLIDKKCFKENFLVVHKAVKRFLDVCPIRRIEATVKLSFEQGHRWMKVLGFELEAPRMRAYNHNGDDYALYARVRG